MLFISDVWILQQQCTLRCKPFIYNVYFFINSYWYPRLLSLPIKSQLGVAYKTVSYKKNMKKQLSIMRLLLCLYRVSLWWYCQVNAVKNWGFGKKVEKGGQVGHIEEGWSLEGTFKPSAHYAAWHSIVFCYRLLFSWAIIYLNIIFYLLSLFLIRKWIIIELKIRGGAITIIM